jgi:hypothetical protein
VKTFRAIHECVVQSMLLFTCSGRESFGKGWLKIGSKLCTIHCRNLQKRSKCDVEKLNKKIVIIWLKSLHILQMIRINILMGYGLL